MKKQLNPSVKAQLLRSALILLLLLAICAIPFALAQRNATKTAHQSSYQGDGTSRSDVPFPKPQTALSPQQPAVCALDGTLGTAPTGGDTGSIVSGIRPAGSPTVMCGIPPTWPGNIGGGPFIYNVHYITNSGGSPLCTAIALHLLDPGPIPPTNIQCSAFMAPFAAADIADPARYLGDAGVSTNNPLVSPFFQLTIPAGRTVALVVFNVNRFPAGQGASYELLFDQDIFCQQGGPSPTGTPSPGATSTPACFRPPPGVCASYEAESTQNSLEGSAIALDCPTCSNGAKVSYVGSNDGTLQFNSVGIIASGNYTMTICYLNGDAVRYALLSVNGSPGMPVSFPSTGSFHTVGSIQITVTLNTGCNTLEFSNPIVGSWAPDFDSIRFNCPDCGLPTPTATPTSTPIATATRTPTPSPTPTPTLTPAAWLGNISTRSLVQTGDDVMIGGFIVQGSQPKRVILRAIGAELSQHGVPNPMANPILELHNAAGALIASNNDWQRTIIGGIITSDQVQDIQNSGHAPGDANESAIIADLRPGNYTAIVRGVNNTLGVALVEAYDLSPSLNSILGNISTRSFVQTDDDLMIGGFIVQGGQPKNVIIRAIGPELSQHGVPNFLTDPTLELHNGSGALIASNNNWQQTIIGGIITQDQVQNIQNSGHAPADASESAIIANLPPGNYTAIVRGVNNTTGVALVEVYDLH